MRRLNEMGNKNFCFDLVDMSALSPFDRMTIISHNYFFLTGLQTSLFLSGINFRSQIGQQVRFGQEFRATHPAFAPFLGMMERLTIEEEHRSDSSFARSPSSLRSCVLYVYRTYVHARPQNAAILLGQNKLMEDISSTIQARTLLDDGNCGGPALPDAQLKKKKNSQKVK